MLIDQHNEEIQQNLHHWKRKPVLQSVYDFFYERISRWVNSGMPEPILELGSGMGNIKRIIPRCITSDLFRNPWLDRVENAYQLNWPDQSIGHLILFDVFHHLQYPGTALQEFARVVSPGGRLIIFEPGMGLIPQLILRMFHHEPLGLHDRITWKAPDSFNASEQEYYAAQGNGWRVFVKSEQEDLAHDWKVLAVEQLAGWSWLLCGGLRGPQLYPTRFFPLILKLERLLDYAPSLFSARLMVVLERKADSSL